MTVDEHDGTHIPVLALVCPDYVEKFKRDAAHDKLVNDTVTFI